MKSTTFDLFVPDEQRQPILNSIRRYRAACREMFGAVLAVQAAGGDIVETEDNLRLNPARDQGAAVLAAIFARTVEKVAGARGAGVTYTVKGGKGLGYDLRQHFFTNLYPEAMSFVWDSARRDVSTAWLAKDPEFTRATRGWLALQGARGITQFQRRGIGFPVATGRPKLDGKSLFLKWDNSLGLVEFRLPQKLDGGRHRVWKCLRDGEVGWQLGTLYLSERDGEIFATVTHERPADKAALDPERVCTLTIQEAGVPATFLTLAAGEDLDVISGEETLAWLNRMRSRRAALEARRAACGSPRRPWGFKKGFRSEQAILSRVSEARERGCKDRNHAWTRRIISRCVSWGCGKLTVTLPEKELFGHPWGWAQFREFLTYKATDAGITLVAG
jgi:hypothetical protein